MLYSEGFYKYVIGFIRGFCPTNLKKLILEENVGGFDLLVRTALGVLAIIALAMNLVKSSPLKWVVAVIAFTGLFTSIMRHCSPYVILGINTAKK
ncbi:DUF2892 domain-containing protein [Methanosarcina sp. KYL-1]|uniref:YgaP family membrane protein n=1 Tax=Methanosarcina sp. KYL-1 TaxID=2602068 RepID=UPI00350E55CF